MGGGVMFRANVLAALRHAGVRGRLWLGSPGILAVLALVGVISAPQIEGLFSAAETGPFADQPVLQALALSLIVWQATFFIAWLVALGYSDTLRAPVTIAGHVAPALPIGWRTRALTDAALVLVLTAALAGAVLAAGSRVLTGRIQTALAPEPDIALLTRFVLLGLPVLLVFLLPSRNEYFWFLRPIVVVIPEGLAAALGWLKSIGACAAASAILTVLVWAATKIELPALNRRRRRAPAGLAARTHRPGGLQLPLDLWLTSLRNFAVLGGVWLCCEVIAAAWGGAAGLRRSFLSSVMVGGLIGGGGAFVLLRPFGMPLFMGMKPRSGREFDGAYFGRAWSVLPVRPESVCRWIFVHTLVMGGVLAAAMVLRLALAGELDSGEHPPIFLLAPIGFLLLPASAWAAALASGDSRRGVAPLVCLVLFMFVFHSFGLLLLTPWFRAHRVLGWSLFLGTVAAISLVAVGSVLPVLVRRRAPADRKAIVRT